MNTLITDNLHRRLRWPARTCTTDTDAFYVPGGGGFAAFMRGIRDGIQFLA